MISFYEQRIEKSRIEYIKNLFAKVGDTMKGSVVNGILTVE